MRSFFLRLAAILFAVTSVFIAARANEDSQANPWAQYYGFSGVELFKLDERAANLVAGDFDSDGLTDILAVDNRASCVRFFRQQQEGDESSARKTSSVNDLESDRRFDIRQISVDKKIAGMVANDFNADGRIDIAYIGAPDRLVVRYQPEKGKADWAEKWSVRLPDLDPVAWMIASGDLNGDQLMDIAVLGKNATYIVYQQKDGEMSAPSSLINTSSQLSLLQIADLDGDGRGDLSYQATEGSSRGLCARLQTADGRLGPEVRFDLEKPRAVTVADIDGVAGAEVMTVDSRSGRVQISKLTSTQPEADALPKRLVQFGIGEASSSKGRALGIGDVDGDKLLDVVVTDAENAQVLVYRQNGVDGLETAEKFPSLLGATDLNVADLNGDGISEVIVMSEQEAAIGISEFRDGRLSFPKIVFQPKAGLKLAGIEFLTGKPSRLAVFMTNESRSSKTCEIQFLNTGGDTAWEIIGKPLTVTSKLVGTRGVALMPVDLDQNKQQDLAVVPLGSGNDGIAIIPGDLDSKDDTPLEPKQHDMGIATDGQLFSKGTDLFVARESFARRMQLNEDTFTVIDQFNAGESQARIAGVAVLDLDGQPGDEIVLVDTGIKKLRVLKLTDGLYRSWNEVDIGLLRYTNSHVADLNGDGRDDLLLLGVQQFSVLYAGGGTSQLDEVATYESDREDAYAADVIAGDINSDSVTDLVVIDTSIDGVELLHFDKTDGLKAATHFRVFEEKRLVSESTSIGTEPREGLVVDVTNDGRNDLVLLCHDRLLVYPQDPGQAQEAK